MSNDSLAFVHPDDFVSIACTPYIDYKCKGRRARTEMSSTLKPPKPPKPDHLRRPSSRSPSCLPDHPTAESGRTSSLNAAYTTCGSSILADALEALGPDDRQSIGSLILPTNTISVDAAFDEIHTYTKELQKRCAIKRWSWNYKGRQVYLADQVDKIVRLLDKFKAVGDVVANVDPIHVGLPWAGIRAILEVCVCGKDMIRPVG
jgi:hypothetical protein